MIYIAELSIVYEGKDISRDISPYITRFTYTDNDSDQADDIAISLMDRSGVWLTDWFPSKGDKISASIIQTKGGRAQSLPCGTFEVDQIDYSFPPHVMNLKCVSAAISKSLRSERHTKAWENTTLSQIAGDIAGSSGLRLYYDAREISYSRKEQAEQSDLEFLKGLCADGGMKLKVQTGQVIIYDREQYESKGAVHAINYGDSGILSMSFKTKSTQVYRGARVKYHDPVKNETYTGEAYDESVEGSGKMLEIRERVDSDAAAKELAESRLSLSNESEVSGSIKVEGDVKYSAGCNINLGGLGVFSGKFKIVKVTHDLSSGYTVILEVKKGKASKKGTNGHKGKRKKQGKTIAASDLFYEGPNYYGNSTVNPSK